MTGLTPRDEAEFGYAFATSSPASQWEADVLPRPHPVSDIDTLMNVLHFLLSALTIFVGVWVLSHQRLKGMDT